MNSYGTVIDVEGGNLSLKIFQRDLTFSLCIKVEKHSKSMVIGELSASLCHLVLKLFDCDRLVIM
jgi:hypothetical protein